MNRPLRILFVEDLATDQELAERRLRDGGIEMVSMRVETRPSFLQALEEFKPDLIISDYAMPEFDGLQALKLTQELQYDAPFIILTGSLNEETAVECMKAGASDYVIKDHINRLPFAVRETLKRQQTRREKDLAEEQLRASEAKFRSLFQNNHAVMLLIDPADGTIIDANPAACAYYGWSIEELTHKNIAEINTLSEIEVKAEMQKALAEQRNFFQFQHRLSSGEIRDVEVFSGPIQHENKSLLYSIVIDVTARKQAEAALQRKSRLQEEIAALGRALAATLDLETVYQTTERFLKKMIDCPNFAINLFDPKEKMLSVAYCSSDGMRIDPAVIPPLPFNPLRASDGRSRAIAKKEPVIVHDLAAKRKAGGGMLIGSELEPQTAIYIPMIVSNEVIGLLDLQSYQKDAYSREDSEWLSLVSNQVGLAIQNSRLFRQTQQRIAELQLLHSIDQAITTNIDSQTLYQTIVEQIAAQPIVDAVDILLFDPQEQVLVFAAGAGFSSPLITQTRLKLGEGLAGKAAQEKRPIHFFNSTNEIPGFFHSPAWEAEKFAAYLGLPLMIHGDLIGVLEIYSRKQMQAERNLIDFMEGLSQQIAIAVDNSQLFQRLRQANSDLLQAYDATIAGWSHAMDLRDKETEGHTERVTEMTMKIARGLGISGEKLVHIRRGTLLHDIGKLGVPDHILQKPGPLSDEEWVIMRKHPVYAYQMLSPIEYLRPAINIPYCHHEKWDGTGYPRGLKGQQIPLEARIFAIVDVYDALTSDRPYRAAWPREKALAYIEEQSGKYFDPKIAAAFLAIIKGQR